MKNKIATGTALNASTPIINAAANAVGIAGIIAIASLLVTPTATSAQEISLETCTALTDTISEYMALEIAALEQGVVLDSTPRLEAMQYARFCIVTSLAQLTSTGKGYDFTLIYKSGQLQAGSNDIVQSFSSVSGEPGHSFIDGTEVIVIQSAWASGKEAWYHVYSEKPDGGFNDGWVRNENLIFLENHHLTPTAPSD